RVPARGGPGAGRRRSCAGGEARHGLVDVAVELEDVREARQVEHAPDGGLPRRPPQGPRAPPRLVAPPPAGGAPPRRAGSPPRCRVSFTVPSRARSPALLV